MRLKLLFTQVSFDLANTLRNYEQLLLNLGLPVLGLVVLSRNPELTTEPVPLLLAASVFASSFTGPAISLAFDRRQGSLKAFALTPLGKTGVILGRIGSTFLISVAQIVLLTGFAALLKLKSNLEPLLFLSLLALSITSSAWSLILASTLRAEAVLGLANLVLVVAIASAMMLQSSVVASLINPIALVLTTPGQPPFALAWAAHILVGVSIASKLWKWE